MPRKCCVPNCSGNYDKNKEKVSVFSFPLDPERRKLWLDKIPRKDFTPTKQSVVCANHFADECILRVDTFTTAGVDNVPGRAGGTWLGMNKAGRIGVLLNVLGQQDITKRGRGFLVTDFVSGKDDVLDYAEKILAEKTKYNGFNLILFDLCKQEDALTTKPLYVSNAQNYCSCVPTRNLPANTFFGVSNSPLEFPFQKVIKGKSKFGQIVSQFPTVGVKEHLVQNLLSLMSDRTQNLPDSVLEKAATSAGYPPTSFGQLSAINAFWSPETHYGTRTTTVILVDSHGKVDFIEQTIEPKLHGDPEKSIIHQNFDLTGKF